MSCPLKNSLCDFKKKFMKFWKTENNTFALLRDVLVAFFLVLILLTTLWAYTGQWFGAPMVAIESGSMMHPDEEGYGRIGYIDAGDMVLLVKTEKRSDIVTQAYAYNIKDSDEFHYGDYGDVIVYHPYGLENRDQIIHRAMCWIDVREVNGQKKYWVEEYNIEDASSITIESLGIRNYKPDHDGFITKGDNNHVADQSIQDGRYAICSEPVQVEWVSGKARGEIPWIGTLNLFFNDITTGGNTVGNVPSDSIQCLIILIGVLISIPVGLDLYDYFKKKDRETLEKKRRLYEGKKLSDEEEKKPPYF